MCIQFSCPKQQEQCPCPCRMACSIATSAALKLLLLLLAVLEMTVLSLEPPSLGGRTDGPPTLFNFGDSNSDTGGLAAGLGYNFDLPNGRLFFGHATGRVCDGRLVIDFLCEKAKIGLLRPYLDALGSNFRNGANFAIVGAATSPKNVPFSLYIQTLQFTRFRSRVLNLTARGWRNLVDEKGFKNAVYMFDIGQNDLSNAFTSNLTYPQILLRIPSFISEIKDSITNLYKQGGRKFWVHNTGPLGCIPEKLAECHRGPSDVDSAGCLISFNNVAKAFNTALDALCSQLQHQLTDATIVYTDIYAIKYDLIANYTKYRFKSGVMACCGHGGAPYNYDRYIRCLTPGFEVCPNGSEYVSWDGIHYTDAANAIVASKILSAEYSKPPVKFQSFIDTVIA